MAEADDILARIRGATPQAAAPTGTSAADVLSRVRTSAPTMPAAAAAPSAPTAQGGLFDLPHLLPESVQKWLPSVLTGPTIGAQLDEIAQRREAEQKRLGRPLTLRERIDLNPIESNPVMMGFGTHQIGEAGGAAALAGTRERFIGDQYTRGIRQTVANKGDSADVRQYNAQVRGGIDSIIDNKQNLQFTDAAGNIRQGELPRNLEEFRDAIEQTKQSIFNEYDALAKKTQAAGIDVTLMPVVNELQQIAADPVTRLTHPKQAKYAEKRAKDYAQAGQLTASDAQRAITKVNSTLKAFYRNQTYKLAQRAYVDSVIANQLRAALDNAVNIAVGPGYQELKNQYGALSSFEKDVTHRAGVVAREDPGGGLFGRLADVATSAQAIHGLATLNPATFASAIATKGSAEFIKYWRSPNRAVRRLFETAEEQRQGPPPPVVPSFPLPPGLPSSERDRYLPGAPPL